MLYHAVRCLRYTKLVQKPITKKYVDFPGNVQSKTMFYFVVLLLKNTPYFIV